jgi:hypothetical protein
MSALTPARQLGALLEPVVGQVYFSPECHAGYEALGFAGPRVASSGLALPDGPAYFTSRGSILGQVPGTVVAAAFGVFNPVAVVPSVAFGWTLTDGPTIFALRDAGALAQLQRTLGTPTGLDRAAALLARMVETLHPEGRPLFAGLLAHDAPSDPWGAVWRDGDRLREYRGDSHIAAWVAAGLDAVEIGLLTEAYWGLPLKSYIRTRAWTDDDLDAGIGRLESEGLVADGGLTDRGRALRERVEDQTDVAMAKALAVLGDERDELFALLEPWGVTIRAANGYPASGPHDLAAAARRMS